MPLNIASVLGFIPTNIWRPLKKFVTKDKLLVFDLPFKLSTKYTPGLLVVMMCLSFANQFVRNVEIDCSSSSSAAGGGSRNGYGSTTGGDAELNDFCWNYDTFLVAKALEPSMRGSVTYPGVSGYDKAKDRLLKQRYYKQVWLVLLKLAVFSFLPFFLWKFRGVGKMKSLVEVPDNEDTSAEDQRVNYYLETIGFNENFGYSYLFYKLLATITPLLSWYYLTGFLGKLYKLYGVDVIVNFMDDSDAWPTPMDALFPKVAKCEWTRYGYGGDMEVKSAQCQLPMNNLTQWSFFIFWWWLVLVFFVNCISCFRLVLLLFPPYRKYHYRTFVQKACREDVEKARTYTVRANGSVETRRHSKEDIIIVNISFGDWIVLNFLKKNLQDWQFRDFVRKMVVTENTVLQLRPVPCVVNYDDEYDDNSIEEKGQLTANGHKAANMEMGFIGMPPMPLAPMLGDINPPPTYSACGTASADELSNSPESEPASLGPRDGHDLTIVCNQEYSININPPVKIDRNNLHKKGKSEKKYDKPSSKKSNSPKKPDRSRY